MKDFEFKKSLGQNFLTDKNIINKIINSIDSTNNDLIIEIGPGAGSLTKELVKKESDLICFEIDKRLESILNEIKSNKLKIIDEDYLKVKLSDYIDKKYENIYFIGNLPYYITTAIINKIVKESNPTSITIMIQKEVALRFMAKPNTKEYNSLSVFLQYNFDIVKICDVSKNCFVPVPKVDSMVIQLIKNKKNNVINESIFYKLIEDAFKQKRKNLKNNLKNYDLERINNILKSFNKDLTFRAEQITIEEFVKISNELSK